MRGFKRKSLLERQNIISEKKLSFRFYASQSHVFKNCTADIKCDICGNSYHVTAMNIDHRPSKPESPTPVSTLKTSLRNGGECLEEKLGSRSCGKIVLVECFVHQIMRKLPVFMQLSIIKTTERWCPLI